MQVTALHEEQDLVSLRYSRNGISYTFTTNAGMHTLGSISYCGSNISHFCLLYKNIFRVEGWTQSKFLIKTIFSWNNRKVSVIIDQLVFLLKQSQSCSINKWHLSAVQLSSCIYRDEKTQVKSMFSGGSESASTIHTLNYARSNTEPSSQGRVLQLEAFEGRKGNAALIQPDKHWWMKEEEHIHLYAMYITWMAYTMSKNKYTLRRKKRITNIDTWQDLATVAWFNTFLAGRV